MRDDKSIVDKMMEIFESRFYGTHSYDGPEDFDAVLCRKYDDLANDVRSLVYNLNAPSMPKVKDPKPEDRINIEEYIKAVIGDDVETLDKAGVKQKPTTVILDETLEVLVKKARAYDNIMESSEWKESSPDIPRKEVISIQPGDVIVLDCHGPITQEFHKLAQSDLKEAFPGHKSVILHDGLSLEVYREQGKLVDVSGLDGKLQYAKVGDQGEDQ